MRPRFPVADGPCTAAQAREVLGRVDAAHFNDHDEIEHRDVRGGRLTIDQARRFFAGRSSRMYRVGREYVFNVRIPRGYKHITLFGVH